MEFKEAMERIESMDLYVKGNLASSLSLFTEIIKNNEAIDVLKKDIHNKEKRSDIILQTKELFLMSLRSDDKKFGTPFDVAISTYLWLLQSEGYTEEAKSLSKEIIDLENSFWAVRIAKKILKN